MGRQDARRFRYVIALSVVALSAIAYHIFVYLPEARDTLHFRNQRALAATANRMESLLRNLPHVVRSSLAPNTAGECDARKFFSTHAMRAFEVVEAPKDDFASCGAIAGIGDEVQQTLLPGGRMELRLLRASERKSEQPGPLLTVQVDLVALLRQQSTDPFDSVILVDRKSDANTAGSFVLAQPSAAAIPLRVDDLHEALHPTVDGKGATVSKDAGVLRIGTAGYFSYGRPLVVTGLNLELFGLTHEASMNKQVERLPLMGVLLVMALLALLLLALPYLKLVLIGPREAFRRVDVLALAWSGVACASIITLLVCDLAYAIVLHNASAIRTATVADQMQTLVQQHLARGMESLDVLATGAWPKVDLADEKRCTRRAPPEDADLPSGYSLAVAIDMQGCQSAKIVGDDCIEGVTARSCSSAKASEEGRLLWVGDREYFTRTQSGAANGPGHAYDFDVVRSRNSRDIVALISRRTDEGPPPDHSPAVVTVTTKLAPFLEVPRHAGYEAAIVDDSGRVVFHTNPSRAASEALLDETDATSGLAYVLSSGQRASVYTTYHGTPSVLETRPLLGSPWRVVVIVNRDLLSAINAEIVTRALLQLTLLFGALGVVAFLAARVTGDTGWLWPGPTVPSSYALALVVVGLMCGCAFACLRLGNARDALSLLLGLAAFQVIGSALVRIALETKPRAWRPRYRERHPRLHVALAAGLLVQLGIAPAVVVFCQAVVDMHRAWGQYALEVGPDGAVEAASGARPDSSWLGAMSLVPKSVPFVAELRAAAAVADKSGTHALFTRPLLPDAAFSYPHYRMSAPAKVDASGMWSLESTALLSLAILSALALLSLLVWLPTSRIFGAFEAPRYPRSRANREGALSRLLYIGGSSRPSARRPAELRQRLSPNVDLSRYDEPSLADVSHVVLTDLHAALWDANTRRALLQFIHRLLSMKQIISIEIFCQTDPLELLRSQRRSLGRLSAPSAPSADRDSDGAVVPDRREWAELLSYFVVVEHRGLPLVEEPSAASAYSCLSEEQRTALIRECGWHVRLEGVMMQLIEEVRSESLNDRQITALVSSRASIEHRYIFSCYSGDQKLILANIAREGFVNPTAWHQVLDLEAQGVIEREPSLRLRSESFARFVRRELTVDDVSRLEELEPSRWTHIRSLASASLFLCLIVLVWLEPGVGGTVFAAIGSAVTGVTGVARVLSGARDGSG